MKPYSPVVLTPKIGMIDLYSDKKINKMNINLQYFLFYKKSVLLINI
jgi:hypothetical protein